MWLNMWPALSTCTCSSWFPFPGLQQLGQCLPLRLTPSLSLSKAKRINSKDFHSLSQSKSGRAGKWVLFEEEVDLKLFSPSKPASWGWIAAQSSLSILSILSSHVLQNYLESSGTPVHKLDTPLALDRCDGCVDVLGHHIPAVEHAAGHVLACKEKWNPTYYQLSNICRDCTKLVANIIIILTN